MKDKMADSRWRTRLVCGEAQSCKQKLNLINIVYEKLCDCVCVWPCVCVGKIREVCGIEGRKPQPPEGDGKRKFGLKMWPPLLSTQVQISEEKSPGGGIKG